MATSAYASTSETTNANRTSRLLLGPGADQLRDVLRHHVPPHHFQHIIKQCKLKLPRLTKPQLDLIFPRNGHYSGDYSDMDISLLYLLLRNTCNIPSHTNGWGKSPDVNDHSLAASIERIREARNQLGHSSSTSLSQVDFNNIWSYVKGAVRSIDTFLLNAMKYTKEMDFLLSETMDPEQEQFYLDMLKEEVQEDTQTRQMLMEVKKNIHATDTRLQGHMEHIGHRFERLEDQFRGLNTRHETNINDVQFQARGIPALQDENLYISQLKERLIEENQNEAQEIPLSPIQEGGHKLPIEQLFSSVVIKGDIRETRKSNSAKERDQEKQKEVKSPGDLLMKNGKPVYRIFMLGDAAHGKTTYCLWLLKTWCNTQQQGLRPHNEWENALNDFDFVFHLPMRHMDPSRANVSDMICHDIFEADTSLKTAAKHVLSSHKYRCLVIMDGLDEWRPEQTAIGRLRYKGMPNLDNMTNCVIFTTMRPWKFSGVAGFVRNRDRVIELQGLDDKSIEVVIKKVLEYYFEIKPATVEYQTMYEEMIGKLKDKTMRSFVRIPLLAVVCVQIWYKGRQVGDSLTSFYSLMIDMMIERALRKMEIQNVENKEIKDNLPKILSDNENITSYISILLKLGKVAFDGLLSNKETLEFQLRKLEKEIGKSELHFALNVGLISQKEAPSLTTRNVTISFFHKSIQEFLAVIYIVSQNEARDSFGKHLSSVKLIMELSNVIMFICGMRSRLGSEISKRVAVVMDGDKDICKYRESLFEYSPVKELYKLQLGWFRELQCGRTDSPVKFHVSDIYLNNSETDREAVKMTRELLCSHHDDIRSLWLLHVPSDGERSIPNTELNDFLSDIHKTRSLVMVYISGYGTGRSIQRIVGPSLKYLHLYGVGIQDNGKVHQPFITRMERLEVLDLDDVKLDDRDIGLSQLMPQLSQVTLVGVNMTQSGWLSVIRSLVKINNQFVVRLLDTNIDTYCVSVIRRHRHLEMTQNDRSEFVIEKKSQPTTFIL